jgi:1-acyl-sn-glycerol-3-phosphate acyltransferase
MAHALQWLRSVLFIVQMYLAMAIFAVGFTPFALFSRRAAFAGCHTYCRWVRWTARWMIGLRSEVRGQPPQDEVLVAAKHHSFFDIIILFSAMPRSKFIMKKELKWAPILGWYALRIGCVPVDRGKRGQAIAAMMQAVHDGRQEPGQLIIYPEGTRTAPGAPPAYKVGSSVLYTQLGQDCVPAATNVGVFWPRRGLMRKPGLAVVEFLPRIPPGLPGPQFMAELEGRIETATNALMAEAGFVPLTRRDRHGD